MGKSSPEVLAQVNRDLDLLDSIHNEVAEKLTELQAEVQELRARWEPGSRPHSVRSVSSGPLG